MVSAPLPLSCVCIKGPESGILRKAIGAKDVSCSPLESITPVEADVKADQAAHCVIQLEQRTTAPAR